MRRRWTVLALPAAAWLAVFLLAGCSAQSRDKVLSFFFDGFGEEAKRPLPPTRRVRRDLLREIEEVKQQLAEAREAAKARKAESAAVEPERAVEKAKTWEDALALLPTDARGAVDWVQALKAGTVAPRASGDGRGPAQAVLDLDVEVETSGRKLFTAAFSHGSHTEWLACRSCHPGIFPLRQRDKPRVFTMAKIREGEACGACHGPVAFGVEGRCARCHRAIPAKADWRPTEEPKKPIDRIRTWAEAAKLLPMAGGTPDWAKALADGVIAPRPGIDPKAEDEQVFPLDVDLVPADNPTFKVVFPHETHTAVLSCAICHPGIFQMKAGGDPITMEKIFAGEYCGRCHGPVAFAVPTGCPRCHPVLAGK